MIDTTSNFKNIVILYNGESVTMPCSPPVAIKNNFRPEVILRRITKEKRLEAAFRGPDQEKE